MTTFGDAIQALRNHVDRYPSIIIDGHGYHREAVSKAVAQLETLAVCRVQLDPLQSLAASILMAMIE